MHMRNSLTSAESGAGRRCRPRAAAHRWPCSVARRGGLAAGWLADHNEASSRRPPRNCRLRPARVPDWDPAVHRRRRMSGDAACGCCAPVRSSAWIRRQRTPPSVVPSVGADRGFIRPYLAGGMVHCGEAGRAQRRGWQWVLGRKVGVFAGCGRCSVLARGELGQPGDTGGLCTREAHPSNTLHDGCAVLFGRTHPLVMATGGLLPVTVPPLVTACVGFEGRPG